MDEKFLQQALAELIEAQGLAVGLLTSALAAQLDADQLAQALQQRLDAARNQRAFSPMAARITTHALDAALAVAQRQRQQSKH